MIIMPEDYNIVSLLTPEDSKALLLAIFSDPENPPELSPVATVVYTAIKGKSDRLSTRQSANGKRGGAPAGNRNAKKTTQTSDMGEKQPKQASVTDTVSVPVTDNLEVSDETSLADKPAGSAEGVDPDEVFAKIYAHFPRKDGKAEGYRHFMQYLTKGRNLGALGTVKLNHQQIAVAVKLYADEVSGRERDKIKHFSTFMGAPLLDYVEKTKDDYEAFMRQRYGDGWRKVKFVYGRSGSG
jgi:hypothetical protein